MKSMKKIGYGVLAMTLAMPVIASAQFGQVPSGSQYDTVATTGGLTTDNIGLILVRIMNWVLGILGIGAIISFVIAGILYLTAAGDESKTEKAKGMMTYAIVAVVVALVGYVVINTVVGLLGSNQVDGAF
ncbi:MAG: hypothetical protein HGB34_03950 [Candidatus Moranbacteria bacterium]|nr:hypothetical protein [Candidatus Moranbacteria bacterium]NTW76028.1 hypothetical protein [Candidatus Moranbacteria bacterium]